MRKLWPILLLAFVLVACENPTEPTAIDEDNDIHITNIINIGGDDDHSRNGCEKECDEGDETETNSPPSLLLPSTITSEVGDSVNADLLASDPDGDAVSIGYDPQTAPRDCSITSTGPTSARISCVISSSSPADSPFSVRVTADDGNGGTATGFFLWIVNAPPEV